MGQRILLNPVVRPFVHTFLSSDHNLGNPGANLTYLCTPGQSFMGAKSFVETIEMQRIFVIKDKLNYTMKNCMISMAFVNVILKHGVYKRN